VQIAEQITAAIYWFAGLFLFFAIYNFFIVEFFGT